MRTRGAILYDVGKPWSVEEFELDPPKAGEVLIKNVAAGLCHTDDHILQGDLSAPNDVMREMGMPEMFPLIGGHEGAAIVVEVGEGVTDFAPGDHVVMSFVATCGRCRWCASGAQYLCDSGSMTMVPGMPTDGTFRHRTLSGKGLGHLSKIGAFAEHTVVAETSLVKIDPDIPLKAAALVSCAVPTGFGSMANRANVRGGDTAVVIGCGGIGTSAIQAARIHGAAHIVAVDPSEFKRRSAIAFGATHTAASTDEAIELVRDLTRGVMADAVVVAPSLVYSDLPAAGLALTRKGGTCVITGMSPQTLTSIDINMQDFTLMNKTLCGTVLGSMNPRSDVPMLLELYRTGQLKLDEMITTTYTLDQINEGYEDLRNDRNVRGVIVFDEEAAS
ncbi:NDMA-dependent alcohol dehydrogenase, Rxyl_3153 family protein [Mycolicibacterium hassiacum DSM 44199]|jgi:alcohol dehydrogenase|uniref:alcohol dehydrogenase n=1 Tax=Mycolicibacterium hassiacum (strain DSM 44199 / CIP 105218 / JCM 12690 / 3849) TaxID=1122247 RepID=K5BIX7_MYCHD|nr:Zn-dependent alcohol dehydrogenase [Mycolicibacterium hassiacum]EKF22134.1 NDMA-dependent alcohol dehydrogenase, Rxyl_3153 family protein [Mycolicibacterium hassiacum DSM 44199]MDA4086578.1 alcohol dehydrogenase [Mycolicibacterium hassiacum DSM 44199]VCT92035.1 Putative alcohol dehydrogenase D [Mycolicibacterium hassiacum DSM 44199]